MAESLELLIPFENLTRVSFICTECKTEVTFDRPYWNQLKKNADAADYANLDPKRLMKCPICNHSHSPLLTNLLTKFLLEWPSGSADDKAEEARFKAEGVRFRITISGEVASVIQPTAAP